MKSNPADSSILLHNLQYHTNPEVPASASAVKLRPVLRLAEQHCANWCRGGTCQGLNFDSRGRSFRSWKPGERCRLASGERCPYLEAAVLPMEKRKERDWPTFVQGEVFRKAAQLYHEVFPETAAQVCERMCPDCGKHPIGPRKRCCAKCRIGRLRRAQTRAKRTWRQKAGVDVHKLTKSDQVPEPLREAQIIAPAIPTQPEPILAPKLYYAPSAAGQEVGR